MKNHKMNYKRPASPFAKTDIKKQIAFGNEENNFPDYPSYPASEDIYSKNKEEDVNPEETSAIKKPNKRLAKQNAIKTYEDTTGDNLDVPGSELDDAQEDNGSEDEENNYYSLGGDDHNDLDEDKVQ